MSLLGYYFQETADRRCTCWILIRTHRSVMLKTLHNFDIHGVSISQQPHRSSGDADCTTALLRQHRCAQRRATRVAIAPYDFHAPHLDEIWSYTLRVTTYRKRLVSGRC